MVLRRFLAAVLLLATWVALCGMGLLPEGPATVPKTKDNFAATVYDASGVSTRLTHFSIDKETYLPAKRGQGNLSMLFDDLEEITFQDSTASVKLKGGQPPAVVGIDRRLTAYGLSDYGPYRITLKDVRRIVIDGKR
jgi:hypothetical protein